MTKAPPEFGPNMPAQMRLYDGQSQRLYINAAERERFLSVAQTKQPHVRAFCLTLFYTGCRLSEARELTFASFQPNARLVSFRSLKKREKHHIRKTRGNTFPDCVSIKNRPDIINEREEFGHWEADLMIFRRETGNANVATVVERTSRFTVLFRNNDRRSKVSVGSLSKVPG